MSIQNLASSIKSAVDKRIAEESRARRGTIQGDRFISGGKSYPFAAAVDCNTGDGRRVWAQLSTNGKAVVVGA